MVDFTKTDLGAPNLGAASFVASGVTDTSGAVRAKGVADLLGTVGEQVVGAYKGYQLADLNKETQATIQEYMNRRENPSITATALTEAAAQDVQTSLFKPQGEELSGVERAQRERLATYQQALSEGVMTPDEFSDRVLANLREATNKNPGLYNELKAEAARVLELSGITGIVKSDKLIAESNQKKADDLLKDMQERAKKEHIFYDSTTTYWQLADKVQQAENDTRAYNMQVRGKERFAMVSQEQARQWVQEKGNDVVRGSLSNTNKLMFDIIDNNGIDSSNYPKFKANFESQLDNMHQVFVDSIPINIRQDPLVQENIKSHLDGMEKIKTRLSNLVSGEDLKKVLTNEVEILKMGQDKRLRETIDVSAIEMANRISASTPGIITESPEFRQGIYNAAVAVSSGNFTSPALTNLSPKSDRDNRSSSLLEGSMSSSLQSGDFTSFKRTLDALNRQTPSINNPKTRLQFLYNNIAAIAKQKPMDLDVDSISKVEESIGQLLYDPNFGLGTLAETSKDKKVKLDVLPSGHAMFIGEEASKFNATYANNINVAIRAYANAHNTTVTEAAKRFYPLYFGSLISANTGE